VLHPGGALGRKLLLRVEDLMHVGDAVPLVYEEDLMMVVLIEMTSKRLGVTGVCDRDGNLSGIITDGDLRRGLESRQDLFALKATNLMSAFPKIINKTGLAAKALQEMELYSITSLFVLSDKAQNNVEGIVHLHDILKAGVV
jgi:arabinose-5-phosphate isomerase